MAGGMRALPIWTETSPRPPPLWSLSEIAQLRDALTEAPRHGLNGGPFLAQLDNAPDEVLTRVAQTYARALTSGVVDPREIHRIFTLEMQPAPPGSGVAIAREAGRLSTWLESLAPQGAGYKALSEACLRQLARAADGPAPDIEASRPIRPRDRDPRLPAISERLYERGLLAKPVVSGASYGPALEAAVRRLQREAGLRLDGIIGPETIAELNQGPQDRARQLALNLERRRWLQRPAPATRIDVNIAEAVMTYYREGRPSYRARVVAGAVAHKTPLLSAAFDTLVVNPPWYVPQSIAETEILPRGRDYLERRDMYVSGGRVIQRPGPGAALGRVKFDMRNPYAIYLHDTPAKALFAAPDRLRSHGCVRVEDAVGFARRLAGEHGRLDTFEAALASGETHTVELGQSIPVRLLYLTASTGPAGAVRFAQDDYGWDERLGERMGLGPSRLRARLPAAPDLLGP